MRNDPSFLYYLALPAMFAMLLSTPGASATGADTSSAEDARRPQATSTKIEADSYLVEISAGSPSRAGATGSVRVSLTAKGGFHINDQYPYRFRALSPVDGVSYPRPVLERSDGQFEEKSAVFQLPFVASHSGQFSVGGVLSLSVCSPTSCIVQKAPVAVTVTVL
jgi:hypothetical protein